MCRFLGSEVLPGSVERFAASGLDVFTQYPPRNFWTLSFAASDFSLSPSSERVAASTRPMFGRFRGLRQRHSQLHRKGRGPPKNGALVLTSLLFPSTIPGSPPGAPPPPLVAPKGSSLSQVKQREDVRNDEITVFVRDISSPSKKPFKQRPYERNINTQCLQQMYPHSTR